jgi:GTPase KRas protein
LTQSHFADDYDPTIEDSHRKRCVIDDEVALLDVFDMAGQEVYSAMREQYMRDSDGFVLVYSITSRQSFEEIRTFQQQILRIKDKDYFPMIVVGNHCDREDERQVDKQEGAALAREFGCPFVEASSQGRINVDVAFYDLVRDVRKCKRLERERFERKRLEREQWERERLERLERELNASRPILTDFQAPPAKRLSTNRLLTPWLERLRR